MAEFNKKLFFKNVYQLIDEMKFKVSDFEKQIGVSKGYLSRLSSCDSNINMTIDLAYKIANTLETTVETLNSHNMTTTSKDKKYTLRILYAICEKTESGKFVWIRENDSNFKGTPVKNHIHPLAQIDKENHLCYYSRFVYDIHKYDAKLIGGCYKCIIDKNTILYLTRVKYMCMEDAHAFELYIFTNSKLKKLCHAVEGRDKTFKVGLQRLDDAIYESLESETIEKEIKDTLDKLLE